MTGSVFKRTLPSGTVTWCYSVDCGNDENGKRKRIFKGGFERKGDADDALRRLLNEKDAGELVKPDPQSYEAFMDDWFREHAERNCTPKTTERYRQLNAYLLPHIGQTKLQDLTALMLERVFNRIKDVGGRDRKKKEPRPLGAKTIRHIAGLVHVALDTAIRWKIIKVNPVDGVQLPKVSKREARSLDPAQLSHFVSLARANGIHAFVLLAAATGCRRGELLAATWKDVDFNTRVMKISKSLEQTRVALRIKPTKTEKPREIPLPAVAIDVLRTHRSVQSENRRLFGPDYRDDLNLVFATPDGNYLKPDSLTAKICLLAGKSGMKGISLHSLRHTYGSHLLSEGIPLPAVSKLLGHANVFTTANVYSHSLSKDEAAAAGVWDELAKKAKIS